MTRMQLYWILGGAVVIAAAAIYAFTQYMGSRAFRGLDQDVLNAIEFLKRKS